MCKKCELLKELYDGTSKTDRQYFVMTELFVMLHHWSDSCSMDDVREKSREPSCWYLDDNGKAWIILGMSKSVPPETKIHGLAEVNNETL